MTDWDPTKWIIYAFYQIGLVKSVRRARDSDIRAASNYMKLKQKVGAVSERRLWEGPFWRQEDFDDFIQAKGDRCLIVIDDIVVDVTSFLSEHVCKNHKFL